MKFLIVFLICFIVVIKAEKECMDSCEGNSFCEGGKCISKGLFPKSLGGSLSLAALFLFSSLSNAGGFGLNLIVTSGSLVMFNLSEKSSIALTQAFVFAGTSLFVSLRFSERHPIKDKPLISYDVLTQITGPVCLGTTFGVLFNTFIPNSVIFFGICIANAVISVKSIAKIRKNGKNQAKSALEKLLRKVFQEKEMTVEEEMKSYGKNEYFEKRSDNINSLEADLLSEGNSERISARSEVNSMYFSEKKIISYGSMTYFSILSGVSLLFFYLITNSDVFNLSHSFSVVLGVYVLVMSALIFISSYYLIRKTHICELGNYEFDENDVKWTYNKSIVSTIYGIISGISLGTLGFSGNLIMLPLFSALNLSPEISTISIAFLMFIANGTAAGQNYLLGNINTQSLATFTLVAVASHIFGTYFIRKLAIKHNKICTINVFLAVVLVGLSGFLAYNTYSEVFSENHLNK